MKSLISVIVPVYNAQNYLRRCISSIIRQTHREFELILVDDGSTDNSSSICDEYANRDSRIRVIHRENAGPSAARELGVIAAEGDYIAFVDADDYIDSDMLEILSNEMDKGVDIVQCGYKKVSIEGNIIRTIQLDPVDISGRFESALHYASQRNTTNFLWNRIYRARLLKAALFPKLYAGEDSCILAQAYAFAERVVNIKHTPYNYVMTPNSLCRQPFSEKKLGNVEAGKFMYEFYVRTFPELSGFAALHVCSYAAKLYCDIMRQDSIVEDDKIESLLREFHEYYMLSRQAMMAKRVSKKRLLFVELFKLSPRVCSFIYGKLGFGR